MLLDTDRRADERPTSATPKSPPMELVRFAADAGFGMDDFWMLPRV
jgi:hypothetical protein